MLQRPAGSKCRCDYLQVLSRRLALTGSWQNTLAEPSSIRRATCVKRCGFIRSNTLQGRSQGVLVLSGCVHRQRAETDNSHSNQHCCEYTYDGFSVDSMHKSASTSRLINCQVQRSKTLSVDLRLRRLSTYECETQPSTRRLTQTPCKFRESF
jgi:hypothetical protein